MARAWRFRALYAIWLFGVLAYFMPAATWNPVSRFALTSALVHGPTLAIDDLANATGDRAFRAGHWYTDKAPIPSLLAVPALAASELARHHHGPPEFTSFGTPTTPAQRVNPGRDFARGLYACSLSTSALGGALLGVVLFELLRARARPRAGGATGPGSRLGPFLASIGTVVATPVLAYATSFYGHVVAGTFLVGALAALATAIDDGGAAATATAADAARVRVRLRVAGACLALAAGSEYLTAGPAVVLGLAALAPRTGLPRAVRVADLALGAALPIALVAAYHTACFGAPWRTGYAFIVKPEFAAGHASGLLGVHLPSPAALAGLLVGTRRGLFVVSPLMLLGTIGGAWAAFREGDRVARAALAAATLLLLLNAGYYMWWGGAAAGPRHFVPGIALLGVGLARAWESRRARPLFVLLLVVSAANALAITAVGVEAPERGNVLTSYVWPAIAAGRIAHIPGASNLGIVLGLAPAASLGPILVWILIGLRLVARELLGANDDDAPPSAAPRSAAGRAVS